MTTQAAILTRDQVTVEETWDLSDLYPNDDAWDEAAQQAPKLIADAVSHRGFLGDSPAAMRQALDEIMLAEEALDRLITYASLRKDENIADSEALARYERAVRIVTEANQALAFLRPEILAIPEADLSAFINDPRLAVYRHLLDDIARHRPHTRSVEIEEILAQNADVARTARDAFGALDNADLKYGVVHDEDGNEIELTKGRYQLLLESKNRTVRHDAYNGLMGAYRDHQQTLAALHSGSVRKDVFYARVRGYQSARDAALFSDNLPGEVYDSLIAAAREAQPAYVRYLDLRRRMLNLDKLEIYDLYVPLATLPRQHYQYSEAVDIVLNGLTPLGSTYVDDLSNGLNSRWVDVHETKGKRSGAYSWGSYGAHPVILMNWNGTLDHVFTLAHEAGHAMHSLYSNANQPYHDAQYSIFLAEIASTVNEVLLTWSLLDATPADDRGTRFSILNRFADALYATLVRQTMFAEFEHRTHQSIENGQPLTLEAMMDLYGELVEAYLPGVVVDDLAKLTWSRVPHFYRAFYVFQYATGISSAVAIARNIRDKGESAAERYHEMLRAGGSDYPLAVLQRAGVDLTTPAPVRAALDEFDRTVQEMAKLYEQGGI